MPQKVLEMLCSFFGNLKGNFPNPFPINNVWLPRSAQNLHFDTREIWFYLKMEGNFRFLKVGFSFNQILSAKYLLTKKLEYLVFFFTLLEFLKS